MARKTIDQKIDELAISIGRGFEAVDQQFKEVKNEMAGQATEIGRQLDHIEFLVSGQERRISVLEDKVLQIAKKVGFESRHES